MYTKDRDKRVPIAEALAQNDPFIAKTVKDIARGSVSAEAPAGNDPIVWTDSAVKALEEALERTFGPK